MSLYDISIVHAHVSTNSSDCDGTYSHDYIINPTDEHMAESINANGINDFSDIHFREYVLTSIVSVYACVYGRMDVSESGFDWSEQTDEGYRAASVVWCEHTHCH